MRDESFDADWSRDIMCVADPFIVAKVRTFIIGVDIRSVPTCFRTVLVRSRGWSLLSSFTNAETLKGCCDSECLWSRFY